MLPFLERDKTTIRSNRRAWVRDLRAYSGRRASGTLCEIDPEGEVRLCATGIGILAAEAGGTDCGRGWRQSGAVPMAAVEALGLDEPCQHDHRFATANTLGSLVTRMNDTGLTLAEIADAIERHDARPAPFANLKASEEFEVRTAEVLAANKALREACADYARTRLIEQRFNELLAVYEGAHYGLLVNARAEIVSSGERKRRALDDARHAADRAIEQQERARLMVSAAEIRARLAR